MRGHPQKATCLKALRTLDAEGLITLPAPKRSVHGRRPCVLDAPVPEPVAAPPVVKQIEGPEIVLVEDAQQRALWNTLLHYEHPVSTTMFAGAQIRYLFRSVHGYLGAMGFSASALHLAPRKKWVAWSEAQRKACLNRVVGLSGDMAGAHPGRISTPEEWPTSGAQEYVEALHPANDGKHSSRDMEKARATAYSEGITARRRRSHALNGAVNRHACCRI